ncbi:testis-specific serine/threonine-protein kinase 6-like [Schistocerca nitens]|uniref:testis-specific serine/threonine-protein kinase 6-like n=1 Tax=Schistocerca nitens TaxID=7011 RepID=UPI002119B2FD|nr:testis-specific serine/threonine-protein kinase 6-like [Schistocerca nitens]
MSDHLKGEDEDEVLAELGYRVRRLLGRGTYARVLLAELARLSEEPERLRTLACKVIDTTHAPRDYVRNFLPRELEILGHVHHPHIVHIHSIWQRRAKYYIFMRFVERGDLLDYVLKNGAVSEEQARIWIRQVSLAVQYLHEMDVAHRDLKCENILISMNYNAKLADFGFARRVVNSNGILMPSTTYCGSLAYAPPEIIEGKPYNPKAADVWSLGVVLFVILNKALPFDTTSAKKQHLQQVTRDWRFRSKVVPLLSDHVKLLAAQMLEPVTTGRPTIDQVLESPFFAMEPRMRSLTVDEASALQTARDSRVHRVPVAAPQSSSRLLAPSPGNDRPPDLRPLQPPPTHDVSVHSEVDPERSSHFRASSGSDS